MKIAMIGQKTIGIKGGKTGGIESHVEALAVRLKERGNDVSVYARRGYHPTSNGKRPKTIQGIRLVYVPTIYKKNLEAIIHTFLATIHAMFSSYQIIHYHGVGPATLAWLPRLFKPRCKVVVTFHSQDRFHQKWGLFGRAYLHYGEWASAWFPNACIAVSHVIQVYCRKNYGRQVVYIPNGAAIHEVKNFDLLKQFDLKKNGYILNVGRAVKHKGLHYLADAYSELKTDKKLVIVGEAAVGSEGYFEELKKRYAKNKDIKFVGFQTGDDLKQLFAGAYLYVQPSESEGLAVAVLEAMSFGTPVLVSDIPENLEAMHHAGFSFQNKDVKDLKEKLDDLLDNPEEVKQAAKKSVKAIEEKFNWDSITEHVEEVYRTLRH